MGGREETIEDQARSAAVNYLKRVGVGPKQYPTKDRSGKTVTWAMVVQDTAEALLEVRQVHRYL